MSEFGIEKDDSGIAKFKTMVIPDWRIQKQNDVNAPQEWKIKIPHTVVSELKDEIDELETMTRGSESAL